MTMTVSQLAPAVPAAPAVPPASPVAPVASPAPRRRQFAPIAQGGVFAKFSGNQRAVSIAGDDNQLLAGTISDGDRVDVVATVHYKSATRAHIESLGYEVVANFGDQFSDLVGGSADKTFKMPNPNYYLP